MFTACSAVPSLALHLCPLLKRPWRQELLICDDRAYAKVTFWPLRRPLVRGSALFAGAALTKYRPTRNLDLLRRQY